jgi:hypothetical protein
MSKVMMKCVDGHTKSGQEAIQKGESGEQIITQALRRLGHRVVENVVNKEGCEEPGWDIKVNDFLIEIKSSAGVYADGRTASTSCLQGTKGSMSGPQPEDWRNRKYGTQGVILFNLHTKCAYLYKAEPLRKWYEERLHREFVAIGASRHVWCNLISWEEPEAGFIAKFNCREIMETDL